jgi:hypothetical protein
MHSGWPLPRAGHAHSTPLQARNDRRLEAGRSEPGARRPEPPGGAIRASLHPRKRGTLRPREATLRVPGRGALCPPRPRGRAGRSATRSSPVKWRPASPGGALRASRRGVPRPRTGRPALLTRRSALPALPGRALRAPIPGGALRASGRGAPRPREGRCTPPPEKGRSAPPRRSAFRPQVGCSE